MWTKWSDWRPIFVKKNYPQGDFSNEEEFARVVPADDMLTVPGIPSHSSMLEQLGIGEEDQPVYAEWQAKRDGETILGRARLNEAGVRNFNRLDGVSVEIDRQTGLIKKVGMLPAGIEPAVDEAVRLGDLQFSKQTFVGYTKFNNVLEFSMEEEMNFEKIIEFFSSNSLTVDQIGETINAIKSQVKDKTALRVLAYEFAKDFTAFSELKADDLGEERVTEFAKAFGFDLTKKKSETVEEMEQRLERKYKAKNDVAEFMTTNNRKITPAMKEAGLEKALIVLRQDESENVEFSKDDMRSAYHIVTDAISKMPDILDTETHYEEFNDKDKNKGKSIADYKKEAYIA